MTGSPPAITESRRVVILAPTGKDALLAAECLRNAFIESLVCEDPICVERDVAEGAGVLLIAEEALAAGGTDVIASIQSRQPAWSDLPVLLLTRYGADSAVVAEALHKFRNLTLLERPIRPATLLSSVRTALKARERQYEVGAFIIAQQQLNLELADNIRQRERVEQALREEDRRKDEFLATLAHELRNPLAPIKNALHILRMSTSNDASTEQLCEMIERQVHHLVRLVDDLMEVSRITRGKVQLRMEPVELAAVVRSAVEASRPLIDAAAHQLAISIPTDPIVLVGDSVRLSQVLINLLNNSAKYMNRGGQIWLTAKRQADQAVITVRDNGIGIDSEVLPHIFEMFTQADRSQRQAQGGLGIGLTLVKTLVEMHGGTVEAESAGLNLGTAFIVRLPISKQHDVLPIKSKPTPANTLSHRRILVVDDNRDAAVSLGKLLQILGAEVRVEHDGPSALAALSSFEPSVVLLDIGMPGMDGYEVAKRIREEPRWQNLMLIALTGWSQEEDRMHASDAGFNHHLVKPADMSALKTLLTSSADAASDDR